MTMRRIPIVFAALTVAFVLTAGPAFAQMGSGGWGWGPGGTVTTSVPFGGSVPTSPGPGWCWDATDWRWTPPTTSTALPTPANTTTPTTSPWFSDVPNGCWYGPAVSTLAQQGVIGGFPDGTFRADLNITRAQFAAMLGRMLDVQADGTATFPDVRGHWAEGWIATLAERGIMQGKADGTFAPDELITRAQACAFIARALGFPDDWDRPVQFPDTAGQWACGYIHQLWAQGIVSGYGNGMFGVYDQITRAQAATMLWRSGQ